MKSYGSALLFAPLAPPHQGAGAAAQTAPAAPPPRLTSTTGCHPRWQNANDLHLSGEISADFIVTSMPPNGEGYPLFYQRLSCD